MYDLVTLGELLLRLSVQSPGRFENARQLDVQFGGAEANVAAACARLGLRTAFVSALPENAWGERARRELLAHGVDCAHVRTIAGTRLGAYFLEYGVAPRPIQVLYDRQHSAFAQLTPELVDWMAVRQTRLVHVSGVTAALGDNARALIARVVQDAPSLAYDVNYRSALWSPRQARAFAESVLPHVRYLFLGQTEAQTVFEQSGAPEATLEKLSRLAPKATIALLQGVEGSTVLDAGRLWRPGRQHVVQVVDPIGAGDAYVAGFLWSVLRGSEPQRAVDVAAAVAALKCSTWGDIPLINERDVETALSGGPDVRR